MHLISKELQAITNSTNSGVFNVKVQHLEGLRFAMLRIVENVAIKEASSIIVVDISQKGLMNDVFQLSSMKDYYLEIVDNQLSEADWYRIKNYSKLKLKEVSDYKSKVLDLNLKRVEDRLKSGLMMRSTTLFGGKSIIEFEKLKDKASKVFPYTYLTKRIENGLFSFNEQEFWRLKEVVEEGANLYQSKFIGLHQLNMFTNNLCKLMLDDESVNSFVEFIHKLKKDSEELLELFYSFKTDFILEETILFRNQVGKIYKKIQVLEDQIQIDLLKEEHNPSKSTLSFNFRKSKKNYTSYLNEYNQILKACTEMNILNPNQLDETKAQYGSEEEVSVMLKKIENLLTLEAQHLEVNIKSKFKRLNSHYNTSNIPKELDEKLNLFLIELNKLEIWDGKYENNSLSVDQQLLFLERINLKIISSHDFLIQNIDFIKWNGFLQNHNEGEISLLKTLFKLNTKDWLDAYISWFLHMIWSNNDQIETLSNGLLDEYSELKNELLNVQTSNALDIIDNKRVQAYNKLKTVYKNLYNEIYKKTKPSNTNFDYQLISSEDFFQTVFPITILYVDDKSTYVKGILQKYDNVHICTVVDDSVIPRSNNVFHYGNCQNPHFEINYNYAPIVSFDSLTTRQQLAPAKELSSRLLDLCDSNISLWLGGNKYIVSCVDENKTKQFFKCLGLNQVRTYDNSGNLIDNLTDIILVNSTDSDLFLLIDDYLIDTKQIENIDWQLELLSSYKKVGFEIVNSNQLKTEELSNFQSKEEVEFS